METLQAIRTKRAVREFRPEPVSDEIVKLILDAGRHAQSSKNTQPWIFVVVRDRARLQALSTCGKYADHLAGAAFGVVLTCNQLWDFDIGQAAAYMQLAAWDWGVGSCLVYFHDQDKVHGLLKIPAEKSCDMGISFGYPLNPAAAPKAEGRRPLNDVIRWETW
jgi:nitroreductase